MIVILICVILVCCCVLCRLVLETRQGSCTLAVFKGAAETLQELSTARAPVIVALAATTAEPTHIGTAADVAMRGPGIVV